MQGDMDSARAMVEEGRVLTRPLGGEVEHLLTQAAGLVALYSGEPQTARRLLDEAIGGLTESGNTAELAHCWMLLTIACAIGGDPERALSCHREGLAIVQPTGESWVRSWTLWGAGLAYWAHGDTASAQGVLKEALRVEQAMEEPMGVGATMETLAWIIAAPAPELSAMLLGAAQNEWDRIEAAVFRLPGLDDLHQDSLNTARRLLGDESFERSWAYGRTLDQAGAVALCLGDRPRGETILRPAGPPQLLTGRERQISKLIHDGLSNQQIADALIISRRTVEGHVQHILNKLGFTNRIQIAVWFGDESP
jgi:non-specific serine/threonine protein kinase